MNKLYVSKLEIDTFRRFNNVELVLNPCITLIAGQNGTSKSTLLGMLCQPFSFKGRSKDKLGNESKYLDNYHGLMLDNYNMFFGKKLYYDADEVFRLSSIYDTKDKRYEYRIKFEGNIELHDKLKENGLLIRGEDRPDIERVRFVTGLGRSSSKGEGNFPHPVIYLGMERHWPIAKYKKANVDNKLLDELNNNDKDWFVEKYNDILLLGEDSNTTESINFDEKEYLGINARDYNSESFSAGQSNLGQILTSILAFKKLKEKLNDKYCGGLLLIDELDSTLHASSQLKLLDFLITNSKDLSIQIVGTTHSLYLLEQSIIKKYQKDVNVAYLERCDNEITIENNIKDYEIIKLKLQSKAQPEKNQVVKKISIICEDILAHNFLNCLLNKKIKKYINNINTKKIQSSSASYISQLIPLIGKVKEFDKLILILDGDLKNEKLEKKYHNLIYLPGDLPLECMLVKSLLNSSDKNNIWKELKGKNTTKQSLIVSQKSKYPFLCLEKEKADKDYQNYKKNCKNWFFDNSCFWGRGMKIILDYWINNNKDICEEFRQKLIKLIERCLGEKIFK